MKKQTMRHEDYLAKYDGVTTYLYWRGSLVAIGETARRSIKALSEAAKDEYHNAYVEACERAEGEHLPAPERRKVWEELPTFYKSFPDREEKEEEKAVKGCEYIESVDCTGSREVEVIDRYTGKVIGIEIQNIYTA